VDKKSKIVKFLFSPNSKRALFRLKYGVKWLEIKSAKNRIVYFDTASLSKISKNYTTNFKVFSQLYLDIFRKIYSKVIPKSNSDSEISVFLKLVLCGKFFWKKIY
jgi:hypothetical protein